MPGSAGFGDEEWEEYQRSGALPDAPKVSTSLRSPDAQTPQIEDVVEESRASVAAAPAPERVGTVEAPVIEHRRASNPQVEAQIMERDQRTAARAQKEAAAGIDESAPFLSEDGTWRMRRVEPGTNVIHEFDAEAVAKTDPQTGERYVPHWSGGRTVVGVDAAVVERRAKMAQRAQLALEERIDNATLADSEAQAQALRAQLKASPTSPEALENAVAALRAGAGSDPTAAKRLAAAEARLQEWKIKNPDYARARAEVDRLEGEIASVRERKRARDWAVIETMTDAASARWVAARPSALESEVPRVQPSGDVDAESVQRFAAAGALKEKTTPTLALLATLAALKAQGARTVGGQDIEAQIAAATPRNPETFAELKASPAWQGGDRVAALKQWVDAQANYGRAVDPTFDEAAFRGQWKDRAGFIGWLQTAGESLWSGVVDEIPALVGRTALYFQGGPTLRGESWAEKLVGEQARDGEKRGTSYQAAAEDYATKLAQALGSAAPSLATGLLGRLAGALGGGALGVETGPGMVVTTVLGAAIGTAIPFYASTHAEYLERAREKFLKANPAATEAQWEAEKARLAPLAREYALYEAIPELVTGAVLGGALKPLGPAAKKAMAALGGKEGLQRIAQIGTVLGAVSFEEGVGETITYKGQQTALFKGGLSEQEASWVESIREGGGPGAFLGAVLGGAGMAVDALTGQPKPGAPTPDVDGARRVAALVKQLADTEARERTALENGDLAGAAALNEEAVRQTETLHEFSVNAARRVPASERERIAKEADPEADFAGNEARLDRDPVLHFASAEIGRAVRGGALAPGVQSFLSDQHAGLAAVRDLVGLLQGKVIDAKRAAVLESLGLVQSDAADQVPGVEQPLTFRVTDDALPLLPKAVQKAIAANPARFPVAVTPGDAGDLLNALVRAGRARLSAPSRNAGREHTGAAALRGGAGSPNNGGERERARRVSVAYTTADGEPGETVFELAGSDAEIEARVRAGAKRTGRTVTRLTIAPAGDTVSGDATASSAQSELPSARVGAEPAGDFDGITTARLEGYLARLVGTDRVRVERRSGNAPGAATQADYTADGTIVVIWNAGQFRGEPERAVAALEEEMIHVAGLLGVRAAWEAEGSEGSFRDFVKRHGEALLGEVVERWEALPGGAEKDALGAALVASYNIYVEDYGLEVPLVTEPRQAIFAMTQGRALLAAATRQSALAAGAEVTPAAFSFELARQLVQLRRNGRMTEETFEEFRNGKLGRWVRAAVDALRRMAQRISGGLRDTRLAKLVRATEASLAEMLGEAPARVYENNTKTTPGVGQGNARAGQSPPSAEAETEAPPVDAAEPDARGDAVGGDSARETVAPEPAATEPLGDSITLGGETIALGAEWEAADQSGTDVYRGKWALVPLDAVDIQRNLGVGQNRIDRVETGRPARVEMKKNLHAGNVWLKWGPSVGIDTGAPMIESTGRVLSGNNRTLALLEMQEEATDKAAIYDAGVRTQVAALGLDPQAFAGRPVGLFRVIEPGLAGVATEDFVEQTNTSAVEELSLADKAAADRRALTEPGLLESLDPLEDGRFNTDFIVAFDRALGSPKELRKPDGALDLDQAERRAQAALLAHLLGTGPGADRVLVALLSNMETPGIRVVVGGLAKVGPALLHAAAINPAAAEPALAATGRAVTLLLDYRRARDAGEVRTVAEWKSQGTLFAEGDPLTPLGEKMLDRLAQARSSKAAGEPWLRFAKAVEDFGDPNQERMFPEPPPAADAFFTRRFANATVTGPGLIDLDGLRARAYHGTPHKVDRFSTENIGTGEGTQVYGWGLYFAEEEKVAEAYRVMLGNPGNTYTVELDVEPERLLDWDKPLAEQSEKVKAAIAEVYPATLEPINRALIYAGRPPLAPDFSHTGAAFYGNLALTMGVGFGNGVMTRIVSERLLALGIPGIRYLDKASRNLADIAPPKVVDMLDGSKGWEVESPQGARRFTRRSQADAFYESLTAKPTYNYVIFDESRIRIVAENGVPVSAAERESALRTRQPEKNVAEAEAEGLWDIAQAEPLAEGPLSAADAAKWGKVHRKLTALELAGTALNASQRALLNRAERALGQRVMFGDEVKGSKGLDAFRARWEKGGMRGTTDFGGDLFDEPGSTVGRFAPGEEQGSLFARRHGNLVDETPPGEYSPDHDPITGIETLITGPRIADAAAGRISSKNRERMERSRAAMEGLRAGEEDWDSLWRDSSARPRTVEQRRFVRFDTEAEARAWQAAAPAGRSIYPPSNFTRRLMNPAAGGSLRTRQLGLFGEGDFGRRTFATHGLELFDRATGQPRKSNEPTSSNNLAGDRVRGRVEPAGGAGNFLGDGGRGGRNRGGVGGSGGRGDGGRQAGGGGAAGVSAAGGAAGDPELFAFFTGAGGTAAGDPAAGEQLRGGGLGGGRIESLAGADTAAEPTAERHERRDVVAGERGESQEQRDERQRRADADDLGRAPRIADLADIERTLPALRAEHHPDILKAERRLLAQGKKGMLFTNGTGTGKTFLGLGIIKRFALMGKKNVLIVVPTYKKAVDWQEDAGHVQLVPRILEDTQDAGTEGEIVVTTYANFRTNAALQGRDFDLVVYDESHKIVQSEEGNTTEGLKAHWKVTGHPGSAEWHAEERLVGPYPERPVDADEKARVEWQGAVEARNREIARRQDEIKALAERLKTQTKTLFLSATPFAYHANLIYADGYLFDSPTEQETGTGYNVAQGFDAYLASNFGYRMRTGKLNQPEAGVDLDLMERAWADRMMQEGAISGRQIEVPFDYSREFVAVEPGLGELLDRGLKVLLGWEDRPANKWRELPQWARDNFSWVWQQQLAEAIKVGQSLPRIRQHLALGRKVILFHSYVNSQPTNPFAEVKQLAGKSGALGQEAADFVAKYPDLADLDLGHIANPLALLRQEFGDGVVFFNGNENTRTKLAGVAAFNSDDSGVNLLVAQADSMKEGVSAHDTTGRHPRVVMNVSLPIKPTDAIQEEGRAYRVGLASNAIFEYLTLQTDTERFAYGSKINQRVRTAENLAMGSQSRALEAAFKDGYLNPTTAAPSETQGLGGKASDRRAHAMGPWETAVSLYYARAKKTSLTKSAEGQDYFATPEPIGLKMVEWLGLGPNEDALEPSAGHGAIARFFPNTTNNTFVEPALKLANELRIKVAKGTTEIMPFEDLHVVNKYDGVAMNPPFGTAGALALAHLRKAVTHLRNGGRIVALLPEGTARKKFEEWLESEEAKDIYKVAEFGLPSATFERAGTNVRTMIVVLDRVNDAERAKDVRQQSRIDLEAETVEELFERMRELRVPERTRPALVPATVTAPDLLGGLATEAAKEAITLAEAVRLAEAAAPASTDHAAIRKTLEAIGDLPWRGLDVLLEHPSVKKLASKKAVREKLLIDTLNALPDAAVTRGWTRASPVRLRYALAGTRLPAEVMDRRERFETNVRDGKPIDARWPEKLGVPVPEGYVLRSDGKAYAKAAPGAESAQPASAAPASGERYDLREFNHTRTGARIYVATIKDRVERDEFLRLRAAAMAQGGTYSSYRGGGAIPGFHFSTEENRQRFVETTSVGGLRARRFATSPLARPGQTNYENDRDNLSTASRENEKARRADRQGLAENPDALDAPNAGGDAPGGGDGEDRPGGSAGSGSASVSGRREQAVERGLARARSRQPGLTYREATAEEMAPTPALLAAERDGEIIYSLANLGARITKIVEHPEGSAEMAEDWLAAVLGGANSIGEEPWHIADRRVAATKKRYPAHIRANIWHAAPESVRSALIAMYGPAPAGVRPDYYYGAELVRAVCQVVNGEGLTEQFLPWKKKEAEGFVAALHAWDMPTEAQAHFMAVRLEAAGKIQAGAASGEMQHAGYMSDFSKSNNAAEAEAEGRFPASEIARRLNVPVGFIREHAPHSGEWHHVSKFYNRVPYYDLADVEAWMEGKGDYEVTADEPTGADLLAEYRLRQKALKENAPDMLSGQTIKYLEWSGTRNHPRATERTLENVTIERKPGQKMLTITTAAGKTFKKAIDTRGFMIRDKNGAFVAAEIVFKNNRPSGPADLGGLRTRTRDAELAASGAVPGVGRDLSRPLAGDLTPSPSVSELVRENVGLALSIAQDFRNVGGDFADVVAEARKALVLAARGFEPGRGPFAAYAGAAIRNALRNLYAKEKRYADRVSVTLDEPVDDASSEETRLERLPGATGAEVSAPVEAAETRAVLDDVLASLNPRLAGVLRGQAEGRSLADIGAELGLSPEGVRKIAINGAKVVRARLEARGFRGVDADGVLFARRRASDSAQGPGPQTKAAPAAGGLDDLGANPSGRRVPVWVEEIANGVAASEPWEVLDVTERFRKHRVPALAFESAADVLERSKNATGRKLGLALHAAVNYRAEIEARLALPVEQALTGRSRAEVKKAKAEWERYQRTKRAQGVPAAQAAALNFSAAGQALVLATNRLFATSGGFAQRQGVQVWDDKANNGAGGYRLIGNGGEHYFPRVLRDDVQKVIDDPDKHAGLRRKLEGELIAAGWSQAQVKAYFEGTAPGFLQRNDFFGQLEMARNMQLPDAFYSYRFDDVIGGFVRGYSERLGQIMAFGQKLKRDPASKDLFDEALEEARNAPTREFVQNVQKQVYRISERSGWNRFTQNVRTLASGLLLANPFTTVPRNMISGLLANIDVVGTVNTLKGLWKVISGQVNQMTAKQLGTVKANFLDALDWSDPEMDTAKWIRAFTGTTLKASGYDASERFVRTVATAAAMQFVTDYLHAAQGSKAAEEAEAMLRRLGVDPAAVKAEAGDFKQGRASRTAVRALVRAAQFGYDVSQVPLWANGPTGRLFYQFGRWGTQRTRTLWKHVFEPALFGELVEKNGTRYRVRRLKPLATVLAAAVTKSIAVGASAVLTGEFFAAWARLVFDRDRDDEDWDIIFERLKDGDEGAVKSGMERLLNDVMMGGMLGILGQPVDLLKSWVQGARFKNPIEPPASSIPRSVYEVLRSWYERGMPASVEDAWAGAGRDLWLAVRGTMPGLGAAEDALRGRLGGLVAEEIDYFETADNRRKLANLRKAAARFARETGIETTTFEGRMSKRPQSATYDRLQNALLLGDTEGAGKVLGEYMNRFGAEHPERAWRSVAAAMQARQPIRVGSHRSEEVKQEFGEWAAAHLDPERYAEFQALQRTYEDTARSLGLMK